MSEQIGEVTWISGPVVRARGSRQVGMLELVEVGEEGLVGEIIGLEGDIITIQVYEETSGLHPGAPVYGTGLPLSVELGPGLLRSIFDGIQRPLPELEKAKGSFITRGLRFNPLDRKARWNFQPRLHAGDKVKGGDILGTVQETEALEHRIMLHPNKSGTLKWIAEAGEYTLEQPIARLESEKGTEEITMIQRWPIRRPRPYKSRRRQTEPLITGQRVLDSSSPSQKAARRPSRAPSGPGRRSPSTASPNGRMPRW